MLGPAAVIAVLLAGPLAAGDEKAPTPKSGVEKGGNVDAFQVRDVTGPSAGKQLCYI